MSERPRARAALIVIASAIVVHAPSYFRTVLDLDETSYAALACRLLNGGEPYRDAVENKFPAIFYIYKGLFAAFGRYNMLAVHLACTVAAIATGFTLGAIARRLAGERAAFWTALFYVLFSAAFYPKMLAGNTEMFAVLPSALAMLAYLAARERNSLALYAVAGVFGGAATLCKQVAAATFVALAADRVTTGRRAPARALIATLAILLGVAATLGATAAFLRSRGVLDDAVFWSWTYIFRHYMPSGTRDHGFAFNLLTSFLPFLLYVSPLVLLGARVVRRAALSPIAWWLVGSTFASLVGGRMYGHYFLLFVPALAVYGGLGYDDWLTANAKSRHVKAFIAFLVVGSAGFMLTAVLWDTTTDGLVTPKPDYRRAAAYVKSHSPPDARVFVWGWFPALYVYADRCPSTRFVYTHLLTGSAASGTEARGHNVPEAWDMLMTDLNADPPAFIFDTATGEYGFEAFPIAAYGRLASFVNARYVVDTEVEGIRIYRRRP